MDANEIAAKSQQSQTLRQQIEAFRKDRVQAIADADMPIELPSPHKIVLHLIPEEAFCGFEIGQQDLTYFLQWMPLLHFTGGWSQDHNVEGMVSFDRVPGMPSSGYVQLYRNGIIESVADDVTFFHPMDQSKKHRLFKTDYLREVPARLLNYLVLYQRLGVNPPVWLFMSFVGMNGVGILSNDFLRSGGRPIKENQILTPGREIEDLALDAKAFLKPGWDKLWNAAGFPYSP